MKVTARVQVTVEFSVAQNWGSNWSAAAIHEDAAILAKKRIEELCNRYVTLIGQPKVVLILVEDAK